jgi:hypothetical protein
MAKNERPYKGGVAKKPATKENYLTQGGIETPVQAFGWGNPDPLRVGPFVAYYGDHKQMGSQMLPTKLGGRGGDGESIKKDLNKPAFRSRTMGKENA